MIAVLRCPFFEFRIPTPLSPVNTLQEITVKRHQAHPVYKVTTNGMTFSCTVTAIGATATAEGFSKIASKKNAAIAVLQMLGEDTSGFKHESVTSLAFNAVGRLSELCVQECMVSPRFEQQECQVEMHFIFSCVLDKLKTLGYGSSKKEAKQASALAMLKL